MYFRQAATSTIVVVGSGLFCFGRALRKFARCVNPRQHNRPHVLHTFAGLLRELSCCRPILVTVSSCSYYISILQPFAALGSRDSLWAVVPAHWHAMPLLGSQGNCGRLQRELDELTRKMRTSGANFVDMASGSQRTVRDIEMLSESPWPFFA